MVYSADGRQFEVPLEYTSTRRSSANSVCRKRNLGSPANEQVILYSHNDTSQPVILEIWNWMIGKAATCKGQGHEHGTCLYFGSDSDGAKCLVHSVTSCSALSVLGSDTTRCSHAQYRREEEQGPHVNWGQASSGNCSAIRY